MSSPKSIGRGHAIRILTYVQSTTPDGRLVISIENEDGIIEYSAYAATAVDALNILFNHGYELGVDVAISEDRVTRRTRRRDADHMQKIGWALKRLSYHAELYTEHFAIGIHDERNDPEFNAFGKTLRDAEEALYDQGYEIVTSRERRGKYNAWHSRIP